MLAFTHQESVEEINDIVNMLKKYFNESNIESILIAVCMFNDGWITNAKKPRSVCNHRYRLHDPIDIINVYKNYLPEWRRRND